MPNRWGVAIAAILLQVALSALYRWSVFRVALTRQFCWTISEVTLIFTSCIVVVGIAAFFGGLWLNRVGPRVVAITGGFLYRLGGFLASFSAHKLWWLYLSYGVIGGIELGFRYLVPVAVRSARSFGALLIAHLHQSNAAYGEGLHVIASVMAISVLVSWLVSPRRQANEAIRSTQSQQTPAA